MADLLRFPTYRDAFNEARGPFKRTWSHPAVLNARMETCSSVSAFLRKAHCKATEAETFEAFCRVYRKLIDDALQGKPLPHPAYQRAEGGTTIARPAAPVDGGALLKSMSEQLRQQESKQ